MTIQSSVTDFLKIDNSVSMHHRNIEVLATELYKLVNGLSPNLVCDCFKLNNMTVYSTRNKYTFYSRLVRTVLHGTESPSHLGPKILELVSNDMKNLSKLTAFKKAIKQWKPHACPYRLCRTHSYQVGFVSPLNIKSTSPSRFSFLYMLLGHYLLHVD